MGLVRGLGDGRGVRLGAARGAPQQPDPDPDLEREQDRGVDGLGEQTDRDHRGGRDPDDDHDAEHLGLGAKRVVHAAFLLRIPYGTS